MIENNISHILSSNNAAIRRTNKNGAIFYSVVDFIGSITTSKTPKVYWKNLKGKHYILHHKVNQLKLISKDNKERLTDCASEEILEFIFNFIPFKSLK